MNKMTFYDLLMQDINFDDVVFHGAIIDND